MSKLRLGVDLDDVLCDFVPQFVSICHDLYGTDLSTEPVDWDWSNLGLSKRQLDAAWNVVRKTSNFWLKLPRRKDAPIGSMHRLRETTMYFITSRLATAGASIETQSAEWLREKYYGGVIHPFVISGCDKGDVARVLRLTHFIDDNFENCKAVADKAPGCRVYLKDVSSNQHQSDPRITRIGSFDEFSKLVAKGEWA